MSSSNKCNKIFGQSWREDFWTPNKSDPWGQNTPFCHDIRRAKTTILPVNKILMRFSPWTLSICRDNLFLSSYMPCSAHCVGNRLLTNYILRLAISILFVSCRGRKPNETSYLFKTQNNSRNSTWNCTFLIMKLRNPIYTPTIFFKAYQRYATGGGHWGVSNTAIP